MTGPAVALFLERAEILRSSTAVPTIDATAFHLTIDSNGTAVASLTAPDDDATIAYFTRIREFDTPKKAIYVAKFFSLLEDGASPRRRAGSEVILRTASSTVKRCSSRA